MKVQIKKDSCQDKNTRGKEKHVKFVFSRFFLEKNRFFDKHMQLSIKLEANQC